ncbi:hypothetical protein [endosymbiont GvMRE of Glomus versiforme]|uniref:hypothetical protein n=1 Tax=endosymbiont GvMRE of Glomus versiforme TaxID=2039283 RepID=UPI000EDDC964|nr:hypothetical protein [endosymbiont GvMRE of Glomus versiforme]RHZ35881.1 hypothetical protein GvMRE_Ic4g48 [endosymbiont GvMRE of Glomus versiforme]
MNNIADLTFIYDTKGDMCFVWQGRSIRELTIKGDTERNGEVNGTWFQVNHLTNHWISFRKNQYRLNTWEAFYKCVQREQITFYRRLLPIDSLNSLLTFSFTEKDEWIKDPVSGKWKNK